MSNFARYPSLDKPPQRRLPAYHKNVHERSMFVDTGYGRSFYVIHPDWTSEAATARRLSVRARGRYAYDQRPSVQPLIEYIQPLWEKRQQRDTLLQRTLSAAKSADESRRAVAAQPPNYEAQMRSSMSAISQGSPAKGTGSWLSPSKYYRNIKNTHNFAQGSRLPEKLRV